MITKSNDPVITYEYVEAISEDIHHKPHVILVENDDKSLSLFYPNDRLILSNLLLTAANNDKDFKQSLFEVCDALRSQAAHRENILNTN